jgi:hypothetical protein
MIPINAKSHCTVSRAVCRNGCPSKLTPYYETSELPKDERTKLFRQYTTMRLVHPSKDKTIKYAYPLKPIHDELATTSLAVWKSGASNILLSRMSFECLIKTSSGKEIRDRICFPLKIERANTEENSVLSYDMVVESYGSKENLYSAIERLFSKGRALANIEDHKHGHRPAYNPNLSKEDRFILHTEQLLAAFLLLPETAQMLCDQLRGAIRAENYKAVTVKVYNIGLHMHSTKTCCAPCEYALIGLMNEREGFMQNGQHLGFLHNFAKACVLPSQPNTENHPTPKILIEPFSDSDRKLGRC